jgi:hypothetical protein
VVTSQSEYSSKLFIRGRPDLAAQIESKRSNPNRQKEKPGRNSSLTPKSVKRIRTASPVSIHEKSAVTSKNTNVYNSSELDPLLAIDRVSTNDFRLDFHEDFPMALSRLLDKAASHKKKYSGTGLAEILGWQSHGLAFEIYRPDLMEALLKRCMKGSYRNGKRYTAFQDILSRFEFESIKNPKVTVWCNDLFCRGAIDAVEWLQARAPPPKPSHNESLREALEVMDNAPFLERLHFALCNAKIFGVSHILSWEEEGKSLQIHDPDEFEETILPYISKQGSYISFSSSLNRFNFINRFTVLGKGSYQHPLFVEDKPDQVPLIEPRC